MPVNAEILRFVQRTMERQAKLVDHELRTGLISLAVIASLAPLVGLFGTVYGIMFECFRSFSGGPSTEIMIIGQGVANGLLWTIVGLLVAIPAYAFYRVLSSRAEEFSHEMRVASLELINSLSRLPA